jgi:hypothetical protein
MKKAKGIFEDINERPVSINKATIDLLLKQDEPHGLIGLYSFYYYTAIWQKTNQPKSTTGYSAQGLKISENRIRRYKAKLIELGLIEEVIVRTSNNAKIQGYFIKVKYYKGLSACFLQSRKSLRQEKRQGNTYRDNSINSYKDNTVACKQDDLAFGTSNVSIYLKYSKRLLNIVGSKRKTMKKPTLSDWAKHFKMLHTKDGIKRKDIRKTLSWYKKNMGLEYVPDVRSAKSFRQKFNKLVAAMERDTKNIEKGAKQITYKTNKKKKRRVLG